MKQKQRILFFKKQKKNRSHVTIFLWVWSSDPHTGSETTQWDTVTQDVTSIKVMFAHFLSILSWRSDNLMGVLIIPVIIIIMIANNNNDYNHIDDK